MALSYLLFTKLKWFNFNPDAEKQTLAGKQVYTAPARVHINDSSSTSPINGEGMAYSNKDYDVVGVSNDYYICHGTIMAAGSGTYDADFAVDKSAVTPIWGGKHPLIRLYQGFKSLLFSKEVA